MPGLVVDRDPRLDRLWELLPAVHRGRDAENGDQLRALLEVIAEQAAFIEDDIGQRYEDWFIETCADWAIPYIGELVGVTTAPGGDPPSRRTVADAIRNRRRKGTLPALESLARNIGDWPARAVEFGRLRGQSQSVRLPQPGRGRSLDVRDALPILGPGGAFDTRARAIDIRRGRGVSGGTGPADVGLFLWRLRAFPVTRAPAACLEDIGPHLFSFSLLANDAPLFAGPSGGGGADGAAGRQGLPTRVDRRLLAAPHDKRRGFATASPDHWGTRQRDGREEIRSVAIWARGWPNAKSPGTEPIPPDKVIVADLGDWNYLPPRDHVAVDPERGRIAFNARQFPRRGVSVSYHYGFSAEIGGGEYLRPLSQHPKAQIIKVAGAAALRAALDPWLPMLDDDGNPSAADDQPEHAVIEIGDSDVYSVPVRIMLAEGHSLQLRAAQRTRPVLRLADWRVEAIDSMHVMGAKHSRFVLDGVMVAGRGVLIEGEIASVTVRQCTVVPGWTLDADCDPRRPAEPSIEVVDSGLCLVVEHSIIGSIQVNNDEVRTEPMLVRVSDSIVDATGVDCDAPECEALGGAGSRIAFADARFVRSTIVGRVMTHSLTAENSLFLGRVIVALRQRGWLRFCSVAPDSRTPRRFRCQPDLAMAAAKAEAAADGFDEKETMAAVARARIAARPRFDSLRYGRPEYARLAADGPQEIATGADDGSEMGVFHHLRAARRLASLAAAIEEHMPVGFAAAIIPAD